MIKNGHKCKYGYYCCTICGMSIEKKRKKVMQYFSFEYKKHIILAGTVICYNCAFKIAKMFKTGFK